MAKTDEKDFFDEAYSDSPRKSVGIFYSLTGASNRFYEEALLNDCSGRKVLEYGCGMGSYAYRLAAKGAMVSGIDISQVAIDISQEEAIAQGVADRTEFHLMDAEEMDFPSDSFDMVCGTGILHHLDLDRAARELSRIMKPDATAIFMEPVGHNPAINAFRSLTPKMRTADEHPLVRSDYQLLSRYFAETDYRFFHFLSFASLLFLKTPWYFPVQRVLDRWDQGLIRLLPVSRWMSWYSAVVLARPQKQ